MIESFIQGRSVTAPRHFEDINPADGGVIAEVGEASQSMVDHAVESARSALSGPWRQAIVSQRAAMLYRIAGAIEARFDDFVNAEIADTGKPIALASKLDVPRAAANFRAFADLIRTAGSESFQTETPDGVTALNYTCAVR